LPELKRLLLSVSVTYDGRKESGPTKCHLIHKLNYSVTASYGYETLYRLKVNSSPEEWDRFCLWNIMFIF
jgi:hypothetical protein